MDSSTGVGFLRLCSRFTILYYALAVILFPLSNAIEQQPLKASETTPKRIAVIGAGAAGSSSAYNLRKHADSQQVPVNITVFERASYVGGRSTTVNVFDDPAYPVELGASIFVKVNYNLVNASRELGLKVSSASQARPMESDDIIGIWDGEKFVYVLKNGSNWWNILKLLWNYGLAPIRTQALMKSTVNKFLQLYTQPIFPFKSLSEAAADVGLVDATSTHGETYLDKNNIGKDFAWDIIQASTRVNYGQNLALIHGLESMVCMATDGAVSISGGNWQIFDGMLKSSRANLLLNSTVNSIARNTNGTLTVSHSSNSAEEGSLFDEVIIAGPLQYSGITIDPPLNHTPDKIPYVKLHVTLFSSPHPLSPKYFNLDPNTRVAETVLTTLPKGTNLGSTEKGVGPTGFWSISTLQKITPPSSSSTNQEKEKHYVYKIFSPEQPSAQFISQILGLDSKNASRNSTISDLPSTDVSWFHEKIWNPYPYLYPRVTFEDINLAPGIWYTGGIESFISTMETSVLMGKNVAALMAEGWKGNEQAVFADYEMMVEL